MASGFATSSCGSSVSRRDWRDAKPAIFSDKEPRRQLRRFLATNNGGKNGAGRSSSHTGDNSRNEFGAPAAVDRSTFQAALDTLRVREKAHTREGDAIAAARRRLPMVKVDGTTRLIGERGAVTLLDAFEGRRMLIAYYFMWHTGHPAAEQCEGCT